MIRDEDNNANAQLVLCSNTEVLRSIWSDILEGAGIYEQDDAVENDFAKVWLHAAGSGLCVFFDANAVEWKSDFKYWRGGPGSVTWHLVNADEGFPVEKIEAAIRFADGEARKAAQDYVADIQQPDDEG